MFTYSSAMKRLCLFRAIAEQISWRPSPSRRENLHGFLIICSPKGQAQESVLPRARPSCHSSANLRNATWRTEVNPLQIDEDVCLTGQARFSLLSINQSDFPASMETIQRGGVSWIIKIETFSRARFWVTWFNPTRRLFLGNSSWLRTEQVTDVSKMWPDFMDIWMKSGTEK